MLCLAFIVGGCATDVTRDDEIDVSALSRRLGVELRYFDGTTRPQDDFYRFVNGRWLAAVEIPEEQSLHGSFAELVTRVDVDLYEIVLELLGRGDAELSADERRLRDLYLSLLDTARLDELALAPADPYLARIRRAGDPAAMTMLFADLAALGVTSPLALKVLPDPSDAAVNRLHLRQDGLGLPDRAYYFDQSEEGVALRAAYLDFIADMLEMGRIVRAGMDADGDGVEDGLARAGAVLALETQLARYHWSRAETRDRDRTSNAMSAAELARAAPNLDWRAYFARLGEATGAGPLAAPERTIVAQPDYLAALSEALETAPAAVWRDYLAFHFLSGAADLLPERFGARAFAFYRGRIQGVATRRPRHRWAVAFVNRGMGDALGRLYVERHFSERSRTRVRHMAGNIIKAFGRRIRHAGWMSPETRARALEKLSGLDLKVGYPDAWQDYGSLDIRADDLFGNFERLAQRDLARQLSRIDRPVDRALWSVTPQTVNAYYNAATNDIVVPAGILQPPFYNARADEAVSYGAIGAIIGHEVSHAFDDQGRKSDGEGNLTDWWSAADAAEFEKRSARLAHQYEAYRPLDGVELDGRQTLGENIGDLGGVVAAYDALVRSRAGRRGRSDSRYLGFTRRQRFFLGWAQIWRRLYREEELRRRLITDSHAPAEFRVNGILQNVEGFYDAFGVVEGDGLYLPPEERVSIW